jgi:serine-aspartate repeat-containing protein C/D/E
MSKNKAPKSSGGKSSKNGLEQNNIVPATNNGSNSAPSPQSDQSGGEESFFAGGGSNGHPPSSGGGSSSGGIARLDGSSSIREGERGSYRVVLDEAVDRDTTFRVRVNGGSAIRHNGNGTRQSYKGNGNPEKGQVAEFERDFTVYDSQNNVHNGEFIEVTIRANQTRSADFYAEAWLEEASIGGIKKFPDGSRAMEEGEEGFGFELMGSPGFTVPSQPMNVAIVDTTNYKYHSPIALDLNGDGVKSLSVEAGVTFDLLNTGSKQNIGWIDSRDGLLAVDTNGNGAIDNGNELFGGGVGEGFGKLASFDSNSDGFVDASDANFGALKVWKDSNSNGVTDAGELQGLSIFGISSLAVGYTKKFELDAQGNIMGERSFATTTNGNKIDTVDVYFQVAGQTSPAEGLIG